MPRQHGIHERVVAVQQIEYGAIVANQFADEADRLLKHRLAQIVREGGEAFAVDGVAFLEAAEVEPVAAEFGGEPARAVVFQHPTNLRAQHGIFPQIASGRTRQQRFVGHRRPEEIAQPAGKRVIREGFGKHWAGPAGPAKAGRHRSRGRQRRKVASAFRRT